MDRSCLGSEDPQTSLLATTVLEEASNPPDATKDSGHVNRSGHGACSECVGKGCALLDFLDLVAATLADEDFKEEFKRQGERSQ
jgi:hypothetical protein